jgi:amino acid permease
MKKAITYIKNLNWSGYLFMLVLCVLGLVSNKTVVSFTQWLVLFSIGAFISLFVLFAGDKK